MSNELTDLRQRLHNIEQALIQEREHRRRLEREASDIQARLHGDIKDHQSKLATLNAQISETQRQAKEIRAERDKLRTDLSALESIAHESEKLRTSLERARGDLHNRREEVNRLRNEFATLQQQYDALIQQQQQQQTLNAYLQQISIDALNLIVNMYLGLPVVPREQLSSQLQHELKNIERGRYH
ncbi:MAG: hypothetical protein HGA19_14220 [Oscillochloris sp.]|nr:hypothetical protein [Oscillochloris sp.]